MSLNEGLCVTFDDVKYEYNKLFDILKNMIIETNDVLDVNSPNSIVHEEKMVKYNDVVYKPEAFKALINYIKSR